MEQFGHPHRGRGGGGLGLLPIIAYTGWLHLEGRGTFFRPQVYERVGISLFEVYEPGDL